MIAERSRTSLRYLIKNFIRDHRGCMAEDVLAAFPSTRYSSVTARISELKQDGEIEIIGTGRTQYSDSEAAQFAVSVDNRVKLVTVDYADVETRALASLTDEEREVFLA